MVTLNSSDSTFTDTFPTVTAFYGFNSSDFFGSDYAHSLLVSHQTLKRDQFSFSDRNDPGTVLFLGDLGFGSSPMTVFIGHGT